MNPTQHLLLVEGKAAANALNQVVNKQLFCVYPLQGKLPNTADIPTRSVFNNEVLVSLIDTLKCGLCSQCKADRLAYTSIVVMMDPDIDGTHCELMLMTFFGRFMRPLVAARKLLLQRSPQYRIVHANSENTMKSYYAFSRNELDSLKKQCLQQSEKVSVTKFKSIAQLSAMEIESLLINYAEGHRLVLTLD